ncbi:MAG: glutathione S-transferase family protein [Microcoleus sp. SIO2G3]|nr:glutathione S-transferase family protein [Microcoleus sp. SIO2G3]
MLLLQFSTSHYCRKARLALGYKQIAYRVENLTPGAHQLRVKPLTGTSTLPVLLPKLPDTPIAIGDSTRILQFLEAYQPQLALTWGDDRDIELWQIEDWLDESIGIAARFVYYDFRAKAGKSLDPSLSSQLVIQTVRWQYGINAARVALAIDRLDIALKWLARWQTQPFLLGDQLTLVDLTAAALLSPLARIPHYRQQFPWLFDRMREVHACCNEPLPLGLEEA